MIFQIECEKLYYSIYLIKQSKRKIAHIYHEMNTKNSQSKYRSMQL